MAQLLDRQDRARRRTHDRFAREFPSKPIGPLLTLRAAALTTSLLRVVRAYLGPPGKGTGRTVALDTSSRKSGPLPDWPDDIRRERAFLKSLPSARFAMAVAEALSLKISVFRRNLFPELWACPERLRKRTASATRCKETWAASAVYIRAGASEQSTLCLDTSTRAEISRAGHYQLPWFGIPVRSRAIAIDGARITDPNAWPTGEHILPDLSAGYLQ
jgi:hypothetical protein